MIIVGVDPATYELGLAAIEIKDNTPSLRDAQHISAGDKKDLMPRLEYIFQEAYSFYKKNKPDYIIIESQYLRNPHAMRIIAYSVGVLAIAGLQVSPGVPVDIIEAKKWRKIAYGDGNVSKQEAIRIAEEQFGVRGLTPDVAEAIGIALAGAKLRTEGV